MNTSIVLGMAFGDEGKGRTVSHLCEQYTRPLVIRFNSGHQAGHEVVLRSPEGKHITPVSHTFSSFGSGTLQEVPTYISEYCTTYPTGLVNEYLSLVDKVPQESIKLFVNRRALVTTPFDIVANQSDLKNREDGTCGLGIQKTFERTKVGPKLYFGDLLNERVLEMRLDLIRKSYLYLAGVSKEKWEKYFSSIERIREMIYEDKIILVNNLSECNDSLDSYEKFNHYIFEGAQGILLDMELGFFPHVTPSKTTSLNAMKIIQREKLNAPNIYYVSRVYQTRHGNGPMSNNEYPNINEGVVLEHNKHNSMQGGFRIARFDIGLLEYAFDIEQTDHIMKPHSKNLVLTCVDQLNTDAVMDKSGRYWKLGEISKLINNSFWDNVLYSYGPETHLITPYLEETGLWE